MGEPKNIRANVVRLIDSALFAVDLGFKLGTLACLLLLVIALLPFIACWMAVVYPILAAITTVRWLCQDTETWKQNWQRVA